MTSKEKLIVGVFAASVLYLVFAKRAPGTEETTADADRVMSYTGLMLRIGAEEGIDPALIASVMSVESGGRPGARGGAGEIGLMQVLPSTAEWWAGVSAKQLLDPATNISVGTSYLKYCINRKDGNVPAGVAAYNYGPDRVQIKGSLVIVPDSVQAYMTNVLDLLEFYREKFMEIAGGWYQTPK